MSCPGCDNSSTTYTRCNPPVSTNCVFYQGEKLTCPSDSTFTVCKGDNMNDVQKALFEKICSLNASIDVQSIEIPVCFETAWKNGNDDLLTLLEYIVKTQCEQNEAIKKLGVDISEINPVVTVCLKCCGDSKCETTQLRLNQALQKIIDCICLISGKAEEAQTTSLTATSTANSTKAIVENPNTGLANLWKEFLTFQVSTNNRISDLESKIV